MNDMKTTVTEKEKAMLAKIRNCEFRNGNPDLMEPVWLNVIAESREDGGVITSLQKKGLVEVEIYSGPKDPDNLISLTQSGIDAMKEN